MKGRKKNLFYDYLWNDTPYYDFFNDEWFSPGFTDRNGKSEIIDDNKASSRESFSLVDENVVKWPERV